jgi:hypothetical protein
MSLDLQRLGITTEIERAKAAWTAYTLQIEYDNKAEVDLAALTTPYLMVDIIWGAGGEIDVGKYPLVRDIGSIILAAGVKEGKGTSDLLKLLQHFRPYLQLRDNLGQVRTHAAYLGARPTRLGGFYYQTMTIPFWSIEQAPVVP